MAFVPALSLKTVLRSRHAPLLNGTSRPGSTPRSTRRSTRATCVRMVAAEPVADVASTSATELSDRAIELISYLRCHKSIFNPGGGFNTTSSTLFRKNDTARLFTPDDELATNRAHLGGADAAAAMAHRVDELVDLGHAAAQSVMPTAVSDDTVAEIIRHDLAFILRILSYAVACQSLDFLHENNIAMMTMLHAEVGIPPEATIAAITAAKDAIVTSIDSTEVRDSTVACFDVVCAALA